MTASSAPLPPNARLSASPDLRIFADGEILIGGSPLRLVRLRAAGVRLVSGWLTGAPVQHVDAHQQLAKRLVDQGLVLLTLDDRSGATNNQSVADVTIVIPVKDDLDGLKMTLLSLYRREPGVDVGGIENTFPLVIVDDGSQQPVQVDHVLPGHGLGAQLSTCVVRLDHSHGPAEARNRGLAQATTSRVLFVDAGVDISSRQVSRLMAELDCPDTVIVAPRVSSRPTKSEPAAGRRLEKRPMTSWISSYETRWSPLDLGTVSGIVGPGRTVTYLPSTCLAVETEAARAVGGFDATLRYGEDVDLVWRAGRLGWCRYVSNVVVTHPPRPSLPTFAEQRFRYGSAAGPLAARHRHHLAPVSIAPWTTIFWGGITSRTKLGTLAASLAAIFGYRRIRQSLTKSVSSGHEAQAITTHVYGRALFGSGLGLRNAFSRPWLPGLIALRFLALPHGLTRVLDIGIIAGALRRVHRRMPAAALTDTTIGFIDDLAYSTGVWRGAIKAGTAQPLTPRRKTRVTER